MSNNEYLAIDECAKLLHQNWHKINSISQLRAASEQVKIKYLIWMKDEEFLEKVLIHTKNNQRK